MAATVAALKLDRGSYFPLTVSVTASGSALDLTGYTAATMTITETDPSGPKTLDTITGTFNAGLGQVYFDLSSTRTGAYVWSNATYKIEVTDASSQVRRLAYGAITVNN